MIKSADAQSLKSIAKDCSISPTTVQRIINEAAMHFKPYHTKLPKHLSFDEFKYAKGAMAFEYINVLNGEILDIIKRRENFPHAKIIIDRFHLVQLIHQLMNKCRISVMNQLRTSDNEGMKNTVV